MAGVAVPKHPKNQEALRRARTAQIAEIAKAAKDKRINHLLAKLEAWNAGKGPELSAREIRELEAAGETGVPKGKTDTREDAASHFEVAVRTFDRWLKEGCPRDPSGLYDFAAIQQWREDRAQRTKRPANGNGNGHAPTLDEGAAADIAFRKLKVIKEQMSIDQLTGLLIPREEVTRGQVARIMSVKRKLLGLGRTLAPQLAGMEPREIEALLNQWARDTLTSFARDTIYIDEEEAS